MNFHTEGYTVLRQAVPASVVQDVLDFLTRSANLELSIAFPELSTDAERVAHIAQLAHDKDFWLHDKITQDGMIGQLSLHVRTSPRLWSLLTPDVLLAVRVYMASPLISMHMAPAVRCVLPNNRYAMVPAHQDVEYNPHLRGPFVTCWVALMDTSDQCGGVAVYPGSHRAPIQPVQYAGAWRKPVDTTGYVRTPVSVQAGDVIIFHHALMHESLVNMSDHRRLSVDCRCFGARTTTTKHYLDLQQWTVHNGNGEA